MNNNYPTATRKTYEKNNNKKRRNIERSAIQETKDYTRDEKHFPNPPNKSREDGQQNEE